MKKYTLVLSLLLIIIYGYSQDKLVPLDKELSTVDYPFETKFHWNAALTTDMIFTQPVLYEFKYINCPTLLIIGTRDRTAIGRERAPADVQPKMGLYNELGKQTQQAIPNSTLVELDDVGHMPHIEVFDRFIGPVLEFLVE